MIWKFLNVNRKISNCNIWKPRSFGLCSVLSLHLSLFFFFLFFCFDFIFPQSLLNPFCFLLSPKIQLGLIYKVPSTDSWKTVFSMLPNNIIFNLSLFSLFRQNSLPPNFLGFNNYFFYFPLSTFSLSS